MRQRLFAAIWAEARRVSDVYRVRKLIAEVAAELRRKSPWHADHPSSEDESSQARSQLSWGKSLAIAVQDERHLLARGDQPGSRG
jgi:hypothetical protein